MDNKRSLSWSTVLGDGKSSLLIVYTINGRDVTLTFPVRENFPRSSVWLLFSSLFRRISLSSNTLSILESHLP